MSEGKLPNHFKLGSNFDFALIDGCAALNEKYGPENRIVEFYGSDRNHAVMAARPEFRLPDIDWNILKKYVDRCQDVGIKFNYTMNTIFPGSKEWLEDNMGNIVRLVDQLTLIGINRVTIANPLLMEIVREINKDIEIDVSTVAHIDTVTQAKYLKEKLNIRKICNNLMRNRSVTFLKNMADYCRKNDIIFEVMVNEFCGNGQDQYLTHCVYRDSCYLCHATDHSKEDALRFDNFPMGHCMAGRGLDPLNWLRTRFIRPEDLHYYTDIGINQFKITGRTGSTEYLLLMAESYMKGKWEGNLLGLWKPLETIQSEASEVDFEHEAFIDCAKLDGFLDRWWDNPTFDCSNVECGVQCTYCADFYHDKVENGK
jgi:collagenase-like PrtC family protease